MGFDDGSRAIYANDASIPSPDLTERAASLLNDRSRVAILAIAAPIIKAQLGKDCVPDDSPFTTGPIGLVGSRPSEEALEQCDALLIVGSSMPYIEYYPSPGEAACVQIDDKPATPARHCARCCRCCGVRRTGRS